MYAQPVLLVCVVETVNTETQWVPGSESNMSSLVPRPSLAPDFDH